MIEFTGLDEENAAARLLKDGSNQLEASHKRSIFQRIWGMLREPMFLLLLAAALIYLVLGDLGEGLTLSVFVLAVLGLTLYQEGKSENSIDALRELNQYETVVIRGGRRQKTPSKNIVVDDLVVLAEGNRVPADGALIQAKNLEVDESLLTGESVPVEKAAQTAADAQNATVFSGTYIIRGQGVFKVTATGSQTEIGKIGHSLNSLTAEDTPLHQQTRRLVKVMTAIGLLLCTAMVLTLGIRDGQWLTAVLSGIALAMAMLPEEYPVVLAIFPALGAHRLAKQGVLTRNLNSIETLGATTVLCTDKTGTLTQNTMKVQALMAPSSVGGPAHLYKASEKTVITQLPAMYHRLIECAVLASSEHPFDPMEIAFQKFSNQWFGNTFYNHKDWKLVQSYPLRAELRAMTQIWHVDQSHEFRISTKGAPEAVMELCHLNPISQAYWRDSVDTLATQGLRVLAVAEGKHLGNQWPKSQHDIEFEWVGLIGLADPIRAEVPRAMIDCQNAGIRVIMITGDHTVTARVIANQAGMPSEDSLSGDAIDRLTDVQLQSKLKRVNVCARISPHQKLRIVQALKMNGEVVTMTGDGVNDAPALRAAHVGVAMGLKGTDVAREAADLILVDDNFASIVGGIRTGRRIFTNLQRSMAYIFSIHIPIAMLALIPMLFSLPPLFLPLHIALLEMIIDPACSLAFENEPESGSCMTALPRNTKAPLFGTSQMISAFWQGMLVFGSAFSAYFVSTNLFAEENSVEQTRAMVMIAFVIANGFLIFFSKSGSPYIREKSATRNWVALLIATSTVGLILLCIYTPWLSRHLSFSPINRGSLAIAVACGFFGLMLNQFRKIKIHTSA